MLGMFPPIRGHAFLTVLGALCLTPCLTPAWGQQDPPGTGAADRVTPQPEVPVLQQKRILWIIPNYRTYPTQADYKPITAKEKLKIAFDDSFDRGTFGLAALFAGQAQLSNSTPSFGQGVAGYARYFGTSYADLVIGDYMTEAVFPVMLHQDPRYFRKGAGSGWSRLAYAVGQIFWTHSDSGRMHFNLSEIGGNATASAISCAYYPDNRNAGDVGKKIGMQVGVDTVGNILKEFWPDLSGMLSRKHHD
jgi:hypothetical protein